MKSLRGTILIAAPTLLDPNFVQTVVLMVQHDKNGALGLVLNRRTETTLKEAWEQISETPCEREDSLFIGGPCEGVLMALHPFEDAAQLEIMPGLYFATETKHIEWLMKQEDRRVRFFVGYAGWSSGQLENELEHGSWLIAPVDIGKIFGPEHDLWRQLKREIALMAIIGKVNPRIIPRDPSHN